MAKPLRAKLPQGAVVDLSNLPLVTNDVYYSLYGCQQRYMVLMGGGSSGKSRFIAQKIIVRMLTEKGHRMLVVRKVGKTLRESCFAELKTVIHAWGMTDLFDIPAGISSELHLRCRLNGNEILFSGLDDVEKLKSITGITSMWIEEASELEVGDYRQLDIRMRGHTPHYQQIMISFNPVSITHWLKAEFFDNPRPDVLTLRTNYRDNKFLNPEAIAVLEGFKDTDEYYYQVYCLGEWGVTGKTVFPARAVTDRMIEVRKHPPLLTGRFIYDYVGQLIPDESIRFVKDDAGPVRIYELPKPGEPYVIGGDIAEGGIEWSAASVRNNLTWNQAATYREQIDTDLYSKQMYCLGRLYNNALIGIEINFDKHPVKELARLGYPAQYVRQHIDRITERTVDDYGFRTDGVTRPIMIAQYVALSREYIHTWNDEQTLMEMLTFVRDEKGRPEHQEGAFDDTIFADAIALQIRSQQRFYKEVEPEPEPELPWALRTDDDPTRRTDEQAAKKAWLWK